MFTVQQNYVSLAIDPHNVDTWSLYGPYYYTQTVTAGSVSAVSTFSITFKADPNRELLTWFGSLVDTPSDIYNPVSPTSNLEGSVVKSNFLGQVGD